MFSNLQAIGILCHMAYRHFTSINSRCCRLVTLMIILLSVHSIPAAELEAPRVYEYLFNVIGKPSKTYVVEETTVELTRRQIPMNREDIAGAFQFRNTKIKHQLQDFGAVHIRLLDDATLRHVFSDSNSCNNGWKVFHKKFPQAKVLIGISHVEFSVDKNKALVLITVSSGCLGSTEDLLVFSRVGETWVLKERINVSVS